MTNRMSRVRHYNSPYSPIDSIERGAVVIEILPVNQYHFKFSVMFGDADYYQNLDLWLPTSESDKALAFINFIRTQLAPAWPGGRGGGDEYNYSNCPTILDWDYWFGDGWSTNVEDDDDGFDELRVGVFPESWPSNYDYGGEGTFESVQVFQYDENGVKYHVNFIQGR